ncbi:MAG: dUTP diphosphatase [Brevinemataceae bacterium]
MKNKNIEIKIKFLTPQAKIPAYQTPDSAGADLYAALEEDFVIAHGTVAMIPTGLSVEIPQGFEMQIRARSGIAAKGIIIPNGIGTIDADYRGEIKVLLLNLSGTDFTVSNHMRIAQAVVSPIMQVSYTQSEFLSETTRGEGGFGSTGLHS